jgi:hypothetical protein
MDSSSQGKMVRHWFGLILTIIVLSPFLYLGAIQLLSHQIEKKRIGRTHTFVLKEIPNFLSEELALKYARETLRLEKYPEPDLWVEEGGTTSAHINSNGHYLARFRPSDPNIGSIQVFYDDRGSRTIYCELSGNRINVYIHRDP